MTDKKISELPAVVTTSLNDEIPIVQSGTTKKASLATILSSLGTTGYYLDSVPAAAIFNAPGGYFSLNGSTVSLSSLLSFSSAAKYTVGPNGNYILNSVNSPAWDWSTGRRRLLIEAIGATNYWLNSDSMPGGSVGNGSVAFTSNALLGVLTLTTLTKTASNLSTFVVSGALSVGASGASTFTIAVVAGNLTTCSFGILGSVSTWGTNGNAVASVVSGPGSISQFTGSLFNVSGLSSTPTIITVTKTSPSAETVAGYLFQQPTNSGTAGDTLKYGRGQLEPGSTYSSYIVSGSSPTARAADVVTATPALLAPLTAASAALAARGAILATSAGALDVIGSTSTYGAIAAIDGTGRAALVDPAAAHVLAAAYPASFANKNFGVAATWLPTGKRKVSSGTDVVSDNYQLFNGDAGLQLSGTVDGPSNMLLDELVVWPIFASDAGLQAQARVYS